MATQTNLGRARSLEDALAALRGIKKARVDIGPTGLVAIEVLAVPETSEERVRADISNLAMSVLGPEMQIAAINVLVAADRVVPGAEEPRRKLSSLITRRTGESFSTQVILSREGDVVTGESECDAGHEQARIVADAVVAGLNDVAAQPVRLESVETVALGSEMLAVVSLRFGQRRLVGSAEVRFDVPDAVARATLHAVNRSLSYAS
jgi:hypothetical protein